MIYPAPGAAFPHRVPRWFLHCLLASTVLLGICLYSASASATTTLTVDLSSVIRPVTHVANGSLYGVIETTPADVTGLIAPLHPHMFNNPAAAGSGKQQPVGDAIVVAGRVAPAGATVTIRLADWFPGWYSFTNMTDWLSKIDQTVARRVAANLTNIYAYEIWNEPNGTWNGDANTAGNKPLSFNQMWLQTYQHLRQAEPTIKITGPSLAGYQPAYMSAFLSFCQTNKCLPDIVGWHDGSGIANNVKSYRSLEQQLGISPPLPITINEYSGSGDITDEGRPGASAPIIAAMERGGVESACITFWDTAHPGRLGSLLSTDTTTNGGWFFYKWYGEMTGNMVATSSSLALNGTNLDGFASLDSAAESASVVVAGINDGTIQIVVKGFTTASFFGSTVHAVVEHTPWVDRTTTVTATNVLSTSDLTVSNDQISVTITGANGNDGYHLELTTLGGSDGGAGSGAAGNGGSTGGVLGNGSGGSTSTSRLGTSVGMGGAGGALGGTSAGGAGGGSSAVSTGGQVQGIRGNGGAGGSGSGSGVGGQGVGGQGGGGQGGGNSGSIVTSSTPGGPLSSGCACTIQARAGASDIRSLLLLGFMLWLARRRRPAKAAR
ncbi:MAG: hypothetical protein ABSB49_13645 [Polyangia bacterium]